MDLIKAMRNLQENKKITKTKKVKSIKTLKESKVIKEAFSRDQIESAIKGMTIDEAVKYLSLQTAREMIYNKTSDNSFNTRVIYKIYSSDDNYVQVMVDDYGKGKITDVPDIHLVDPFDESKKVTEEVEIEVPEEVAEESNAEIVESKKLSEKWEQDILNTVKEFGYYADSNIMCGDKGSVIDAVKSLSDNEWPQTAIDNVISNIEKLSSDYVEVRFGDFSSPEQSKVEVSETDELGNKSNTVTVPLEESKAKGRYIEIDESLLTEGGIYPVNLETEDATDALEEKIEEILGAPVKVSNLEVIPSTGWVGDRHYYKADIGIGDLDIVKKFLGEDTPTLNQMVKDDRLIINMYSDIEVRYSYEIKGYESGLTIDWTIDEDYPVDEAKAEEEVEIVSNKIIKTLMEHEEELVEMLKDYEIFDDDEYYEEEEDFEESKELTENKELEIDDKSFNRALTKFIIENYKNAERLRLAKVTEGKDVLKFECNLKTKNGKITPVVLEAKGKISRGKSILKVYENKIFKHENSEKHIMTMIVSNNDNKIKLEKLRYNFSTKLTENKKAIVSGIIKD